MLKTLFFILGTGFLLTALSILSISEAAVIAVDYGTNWFKVGLVKPGIPLDIVLNRDSKRKTPSVITIRGEERIYGTDAVNLGARFPFNTYFSLKQIIGRLADDKYVQAYQSIFPNKIIPDPLRGTVLFQHNETTVFSIEELLAMQLSYARELAEATAHESIKDVVITVPPYYNQFERQAILDAANIAGLHVLSLINDETAVGLNYAITHFSSFTEEPQYHIFYDMGAGSTKASLISFKTVEIKDVGRFNKTVINMDVISIGYDKTLGGQEIDIRLRSYLAEQFDKTYEGKLKESIFKSPRAMTRLLKEANRVKQILSANTETVASLESLHEERDFRLTITRSELEAMIVDLVERVNGPIQDVLNNAKMTLPNVNSCVLVGGGVRVPVIQSKIKEIVGEDKIAQNVNGDEAAVLGAAFRGAGLSRQFKVKEIKIKDIASYPIKVDYESELKESEDGTMKNKIFRTILFDEYTSVGTRKIMSFKRTSDFNFSINYGNLNENILNDFGSTEIATAKVTGLSDIVKEHNDNGIEQPKVKVTLQLSDSGIVSVIDAIATIEHQTISDKIKTFFGVNNKSDEALKEVPFSDEEPAPSDNTSQSIPGENNTLTNDTEQIQKKTESIPLNLEVEYVGITPMGINEKDAAIRRLRAMDETDQRRRAREEVRNNLETFVYNMQDFLSDQIVIKVSTDKQRKELATKSSETSEWLYGEGEDASIESLRARLHDLRSLEKPIVYRRDEHTRRPEAVDTIKSAINNTREFVEKIKANTTIERYHTDEELDKLLNVCNKAEKWLDEKLIEQDKIEPHADPVLTTADIEKLLREIEREFIIVATKRPPKKKVTPPVTNDSENTNNVNNTDSDPKSTTTHVEETPAKHDEL
ncbi:HSP70-domain-containing protein [Gigaspora margarita]|uniref:HSP70-domain-containing protein n=1 Tax=Gigaspora margarita TaxID=4874 RepID=A0A8H4ACE8_GIGMA|nr:HSP70-domain-containing protein [Gigaspora margarita]